MTTLSARLRNELNARSTILGRLHRLWEPRPRRTPDAWALENRVYPLSAGVPGPRDPGLTPYIVEFERFFDDARYETCALVTGTQMSKTDAILDVMGWRLDSPRPRPQLYVGPSKDFVSNQFEPRLMKLFDEAERLNDLVARGKRNKKTLKIVAGVTVRLGWAGSETSLASDQAGDVFVDEYDKMTGGGLKGKGDAYGLAKARADTYPDRKIAVTSTPKRGRLETYKCTRSRLEFWQVADAAKLESPIWVKWQAGTRHHWTWKCPHCEEYFIPRFRNLEFPGKGTPKADPAMARRKTWLVCPRCGCEITEDHKGPMNATGRFVAPGQTIRPDGTVEGDPPDSTILGLWVSGLASPFVTWGERVEEYLLAEATGDPETRQGAINKISELFSEVPLNAPVWTEVKAKALPYRLGEVPREVLRIVVGVDVQKRRLIYVTRGFGARGASWLVDAGEIHGPTDEEAVWDRLGEYLTGTIGGMRIERALIDSGFRPDKPEMGDVHKVYEFCRRFDWIAYPSKGRPTAVSPIVVKPHEVKPDGKQRPFSVNLVTLDTDFFKSLVLSRLKTPIGSIGSLYVPEDVTEDYCRQLVSEVRVMEAGKPVWKQITEHNHFLDCEALAAAGGRLLNVERIPDGAAREWDDDAPARIEVPADPGTPDGVKVPIVPALIAATDATGQKRDFKASLRDRFAGRSTTFHNS